MNIIKHTLILLLIGSSLLQAENIKREETSVLKNNSKYEGRIRLKRFLDEPDGYCLDVPGPHTRLQLDTPAWAHTCHVDALPDQVFKYNFDGQGKFRFIFEKYDLCLTADAPHADTRLKFESCDKPKLQGFDITKRGELKFRGTNLCLFVEETGPYSNKGWKDPFGRGRPVSAGDSHLARFLELHECGTRDPGMSRWRALVE